jgi:hypothetical protein
MKKFVIFVLIFCFYLLPSFMLAKEVYAASSYHREYGIYVCPHVRSGLDGDYDNWSPEGYASFILQAFPSNVNYSISSSKYEIRVAQRGCCSWHKGVCGCDESTGRTKCCDGTLSPSCRCSAPKKSISSDTSGEACSCSANLYNCNNFSTQAEAQACFKYCISQGRGDIHRLDGDNDGIACEHLP